MGMAADTTELALSEPCPSCSANGVVGKRPRRHRAQHNGQTYTLRTCPQCGLEFWSPLRADPTVYANEGFEAYVDYHAGARPFPRWAEPLFELLPEHPGSALDIGCGDGSVLHRLANRGFRTSGIDLDPKSIEIARNKYGLADVSVATLEQYGATCAKDARQFELVTFFEVLEHQDAPRVFLEQVARLCKPGALVVGSVPNRDRFLANIDRKLSDGDLPPHHFLWFSAPALARLLSAAGFVEVSIRKVGALGYRQIVGKMRSAMTRKTKNWPAPARGLLRLMCAPLALAPWLGMRIAPTHLFFHCKARTP